MEKYYYCDTYKEIEKDLTNATLFIYKNAIDLFRGGYNICEVFDISKQLFEMNCNQMCRALISLAIEDAKAIIAEENKNGGE